MENRLMNSNFIWDAIDKDLQEHVYDRVHTRFPPEPNGYLHIGHCKALCTNFGTAKKYNGLVNLRLDDTNPEKEETHFVEGIMDDIHWLGFDWNGGLYYASDYYEKLYDIAVDFINRGLAYVDELTPEQMTEYRGTLTEPGKNSPYRDRPIEENLRLFKEMKEGKHAEGSMILRAKIDMAHPNINMRDPAMYRILFAEHHRTGTKWCIYPMYDFAHPLSDAFEHITHSLCSLEFEDHRPLYEWFINNSLHMLDGAHPRQIEFARLNLTNTVMSKRYLRTLVENGLVMGWDDPRMPTLVGLRRRGYTPEAIKDFIDRIGLSKADSEVDYGLLEFCVREDLEDKVSRAMAVIDPILVEFSNWDEDKIDEFTVNNHPNHPEFGTHSIKFGKRIYIEASDFMEEPVKKFHRMSPGKEVRLKDAYIVKCESVEKDSDGNIIKIICTVDLNSRSGSEGSNRKVKGTLHWVNADDCSPFEARLINSILLDDDENAGKDFIERFNPDSMIKKHGYMEKYLDDAKVGDKYQFLRTGYFCKDKDSTDSLPVFNRIVGLRDSFSKALKSNNK
ncbi:MAG: glutamine--tRNA ligase/YqeY domain fusion protein [Eubacteriales bacterium]|nr:glutamine--tRNA ligase/YqeY domain fusion protein [Eubacteriales bacterium]